MRWRCFWVEKLPILDWCYSFDAPGPCSAHGERHKAEKLFPGVTDDAELPADRCEADCACGFRFGDGQWSGHGSPRYRRLETGEEIRQPLPPGALYVDEAWANGPYKGADGLSVVCVTPAGHWHIDFRATNCTLPEDKVHRCWVRHGTRGGEIHVDKNGNTCAAGAGSIAMTGFHGFLHHGELYYA
jgi:hypothetical protein